MTNLRFPMKPRISFLSVFLNGFTLFTVLIVTLLGIGLFTVSPATAVVFTIDVNTLVDEYDDVTPNGFCSLREAIEAVNTQASFGGCPTGLNVTEIILPAGTLTLSNAGGPDDPDLAYNDQGDLDIKRAITLTGTGSGTTTIQGGSGWNDRIIHIYNSSGTVIQGVTIKFGHRSLDNRGGGIANRGGALTLIDVVFTDNIGKRGGGGLYVAGDASASLTKVGFYGNSCETVGCGGGAIWNWGSITINDSIIDGNSAGYEGGGLFSEDYGSSPANAVLNNVLIKNNNASSGGGIFNDGNLQVTNSLIYYNAATVSEGSVGGGLYTRGTGTTTLENVTITNNRANSSGGGIYHSSQTAFDLDNVTITLNFADYSGLGGVRYGGGIYTNSGGINVNNTLIAGNNIFGVVGVDYSDCYNSGTTFGDKDYNIQGVKSSGVNACGLNGAQGTPGSAFDPAIGSLQDNGGPTRTHALLPGSPGIDTGNPGDCPTADQRGLSRPQGVQCDIGAYEQVGPTFTDVSSSHWAYGYIEAIAEAGLSAGFPDGTYRPVDFVNRAQMAVFLLKGIHGSSYTPPTPDGSHPFSDISGHWAEAWIEQLYDEGISAGFPDSTYRPGDNVNRAQMAVMLLVAKHSGGYTPPALDGSHPFTDVSGHWAETWIEQLYDEGITAGYPDGTYRPADNVNRAQMAVFLVAAFGITVY